MRILPVVIALMLVVAACNGSVAGDASSAPAFDPLSEAEAPATDVPQADGSTTDAPLARVPTEEPIRLPLTLYLVGDDEGGRSGLGTRRTAEDLEIIAADMASIWSQAGVMFEPVLVRHIAIPTEVLAEITGRASADRFFEEAGVTFDVADPGAVNGFYLGAAAGVNGFAPRSSRIFFVVDEPSVNDERVSSHEVGHILGLHHVLDDPNRLMFSGTNGTALNETERQVARYAAQGILDGLR